MTEQELIRKQEEGGNETLYLMKVGMFFHAYDAGAFALARLMHYRVKRKARKGGREVLVAGFPADSPPTVAGRIAARYWRKRTHGWSLRGWTPRKTPR